LLNNQQLILMSKPFLDYLSDSELLIDKQYQPQTEKLLEYYELYKLVKNLNGSILKCGVNNNETFSYFSFFKKTNQYNTNQPLVVFEKNPSVFEPALVNNETVITVKSSEDIISSRKNIALKSKKEDIDFIPGNVTNALPTYLINNPELKIALLVIDLDNYEQTLAALQYLYPRIVSNGILIISNYYKKAEDTAAIKEYFANQSVIIRNYSKSKGLHYIIKD